MSGPAPELEVWAVALEFLGEAERTAATATPRIALHAAYYAMFHGARAVLFKLEGLNAPTKHATVVSRFGFHAKQADNPDLKAAGRALKSTREQRLRSDYGLGPKPQAADAVAAVKEARSFIELCARLYRFPRVT
jgi:uncharacterized protein (UPF0332 family)